MSIENPNTMEPPDLTNAQIQRIREIYAELREILPAPIPFKDEEEIKGMSENRAHQVLRDVRRMLLLQLLSQEHHEHEVDDCGDYLIAATDNWSDLFTAIWTNDFQNLIPEIQKFLLDPEAYPWGGCDGEVRHDLLTGASGLAARLQDHIG